MSSRRSFIQKLTVAAAGLPLAQFATTLPHNAPLPARQGAKLRVAIMGLGSYANRVAEAMQDCQRAVVTGVISGTPQKIKDWQQRFSIPETNCYNYENFDAIKNNKEIDAVYIITPNALHHSQTIRVARAGKHVICEKPMAVTVEECDRMIAACKEAG